MVEILQYSGSQTETERRGPRLDAWANTVAHVGCHVTSCHLHVAASHMAAKMGYPCIISMVRPASGTSSGYIVRDTPPTREPEKNRI